MMNEQGKTTNSKAVKRYMPLFLVLFCILTFILMHVLQGSSPFKPSCYNSYTLQAMQWRKGGIPLDRDYSYLELAVFQGKYYVSFPPVPTIPIYLLTFIWGENVPDALLLQVYAIGACLLVYSILNRKYQSPVLSAVWAYLICFASSLLALLQNGAVWYQAQVLAFLLMVAAIERMQKGKITWSLLFFALSVGCRPFNVLFGPVLILYGMSEYLHGMKAKEVITRLLPGILLGLCVAAAYAAYNYVRFGDIFEFGHNYLPEYSTEGKIQFSLSHIKGNASTFIWGWPFMQTADGWAMKQFGFSMFLANPILLCLLLWVVFDIVKKRASYVKLSIAAMFCLHVLAFLLHRTGGSYQYGARYYADCIPYVLLYLAAHGKRGTEQKTIGITDPPVLEYILLLGGLILCVYGSYYVHI